MTAEVRVRPDKPLGSKAYGHIGHLPGSRMGPGDHRLNEGQDRIATLKARDKHDTIIVQEKLDGSCVAVARINGALVPLQRAGYPAASSPYEQHHLFADWVWQNQSRFDVVHESERIVGEWLAMAHGTRYDLTDRDPFVAFDLMRGPERMTVAEFRDRIFGNFRSPATLGLGPTTIEAAMKALGTFGHYGALDRAEGAVWRVERSGKVDFLAKYVRPDKVDGSYFEGEPTWNWRPEKAA